MTIYISTGGFNTSKVEDISSNFLNIGIDNIELSGTIYHPNIIENLRNLKDKINFQIHNYFPPHKVPFVMNIASEDKEISKLTLDHINYALESCQKLNSKYYSFHAGFLCDIKTHELGKKIKKKILQDRTKSIDLFLERILKISNKASELGIEIMIENNVISKNNLLEFEMNPLLMCDLDECIFIINNSPKNVKLLLDVAHLKVSSNSLKFDPVYFLKNCNEITGGYHLSDNNGLSDTNDPFTEFAWFWDYIRKDLNYYSIEVYNQNNDQIMFLKKLTEKKLNF
jgi:sugar phosphate isomerase/epimerase